MIKTEFMQLLEELDSINEAPLKNYRIVYYEDGVKKSFTVQASSKAEAEQIGWSRVDAESLYVSEEINEATDKAASKKFWAAAKNKQIDEASFHAAYGDELKELGLMDIFNTDGTFTGRGVYGRIKDAKDANPDSWALKALSKLWALRYVDRVYFSSEAAAIKAASDEAEKRSAAEKAEKERVALETRANFIKEYTRDYKILMPEVLKEVDQQLLNKYMTIYNVSESDFDVEIKLAQYVVFDDGIKILPNKSGNVYVFKAPVQNKYKNLLSLVTSELRAGIEKAVAEETKIKKDSNKAIDVFKYNESATAILLGESGKMYLLSDSARANLKTMTARVSGELVAVNYVSEVSEPYKVIYTSIIHSERNYSTYRDSVGRIYKSWDSSHKDKIQGLIPKLGRKEGTWEYWITTAVTSGDGKVYSTMDNIDSWAYTEHTSLATD